MNTRSPRSEHDQRGVPRIIKKIVLHEKSSIHQVTQHVDETALSSKLFAALQITTALPHCILLHPRIVCAHRMLPTSFFGHLSVRAVQLEGLQPMSQQNFSIRTIPSGHYTPALHSLVRHGPRLFSLST